MRAKVDVAGQENDIVVGVADALAKQLGRCVACRQRAGGGGGAGGG